MGRGTSEDTPDLTAQRRVTSADYRHAYAILSSGMEEPTDTQLAAFLSTSVDEIRKRKMLLRLAASRHQVMNVLTSEEIARSTRQAMRLAGARR